MSQTIQALLNKPAPSTSPVVNAFNTLSAATSVKPRTPVPALAIESLSDSERTMTVSGVRDVLGAAKQALTQSGYSINTYSAESVLAGSILLARAAQSKADLSAFTVPAGERVDSFEVTTGRASLESFDDRNNRDLLNHTIIWNTSATLQSEFGAALYPTVVIGPELAGTSISARTVYAMDGVRRQANGDVNNFNRRNIIRAIKDHNILAGNGTDLVPVYRKSNPAADTDTDKHFVEGVQDTLVVDGQDVTTGYLKFGAELSLLGVSQTAAMLAQGLTSETESIGNEVHLQEVLLKLVRTGATPVTEYVAVNVSALPTANFVAAPQGNDRLLQLNFSTKDLVLEAGLNTKAGTPSVILNDLAGNIARLGLNVSISVLQQDGTLTSMAGNMKVVRLSDASGTQLSTASGTGATLKNLLETSVSVVGYRLSAKRTNLDRAKHGTLLDMQVVNYVYQVQELAPISMKRPVMAQDAKDSEMLEDLVKATRIQMAGAAVTAKLAFRDMLERFASQPDVASANPKIFGAASDLVTAQFLSENLDVADEVNSPDHANRLANIRTLIVNKIRDMSANMLTQAGWAPAVDHFYGNAGPKKTTIYIAMDPVFYQWMVVDGDTRLLGDQFDYRIIPVYDDRFAGRILFQPGNPEAETSGVPNVLHPGSMLFRPELTYIAPMNRGNTQTMELTVTPSYRFIDHLPLMGELNVTGMSKAVAGKVAVYVENKEVV
jgi:hypothetical protein